MSTKTADQTSYVVGQAITYTIVVTNSGAGAGSASVTDTVPALDSVSKVACVTSVATDTCVPGPQTNNVAGSVTLSPGASATFTISGVTNAAGDAQNAEVVTATTTGLHHAMWRWKSLDGITPGRGSRCARGHRSVRSGLGLHRDVA